jgi:hypothetical protein
MNARTAPAALIALVALAIGVAGITAAQARSTSSTRAWRVSVTAPAQFDLSLAEIRFGAPARATTSIANRSYVARSIRLALRGPTGLNYVAAAVTRHRTRAGPRALVLVVNKRPRGSLAPDLARIGLTVTAAKWRGRPLIWQLSNPFTRPSIGLTPALCDLPIGSRSLKATDVRSVVSRGVAPTGFAPASAIVQAYNAVCGLPYDASFKQAVVGPCPPSPSDPVRAFCCPPNAICAPPPTPPTPEPPPCAPCNPPPGGACPLAVVPNVCVGPVTGSARRIAAIAH